MNLKKKVQNEWSKWKVERTCWTEQNGDVGGTLSVCGVDDHIILAKFCSRIHIKTQNKRENEKKWMKNIENKQTGETFQLIETAFLPNSTRDEHTQTHTQAETAADFLLFAGPCSFIYHFRHPELRWLRRSVDWSPDWVPEERDQVVFALRFRPQILFFNFFNVSSLKF